MKTQLRNSAKFKWTALLLAVCTTAVLSVVLFIGGCSNNPLAPDATSQSEYTNYDSEIYLARGKGSHGGNNDPDGGGGNTTVTSSALITSQSGGTLSLGWESSSNKLSVPNGGVESDVTIEVTVTPIKGNNWGNKSVEFDFSPDGLVFLEPAKLTLSYKDLNLEFIDGSDDVGVVNLFWYNSSTKTWEFQESSSISKGHVVFHIDHFSKYGVSE